MYEQEYYYNQYKQTCLALPTQDHVELWNVSTPVPRQLRFTTRQQEKPRISKDVLECKISAHN